MNLGGEGQIIIGGIFGTIVAIYLQEIPAILHVTLSLMAGFIGGALWAFVPGYFNAKHGINIIITTILLNDIAIGILGTLVKRPLKIISHLSSVRLLFRLIFSKMELKLFCFDLNGSKPSDLIFTKMELNPLLKLINNYLPTHSI